YCPPQIWAWASWRIGKMRRLVDHVLSALPFEHEWFLERGVKSTLVGHPFFDELAVDRPDAASPEETPLVLLLPGSRGQEIEANLRTILRAAAHVAAHVRPVRFVVATLHDKHARRVQEEILRSGSLTSGLDLGVEAGRARILMRRASCAIAVSGSVSLELLASRVPTVIVYRISGLAHVVQARFRRARFITLVNLLDCREPIGAARPTWWPPKRVAPADPEAVYPEYLTVQDPAEQVAGHVVDWLSHQEARAAVVDRLDAMAQRVATGGSADRAAEAVLGIAAARRGAASVGRTAVAADGGCRVRPRAA
ncbi:MAG: hypothetical protein ACKOTB_16695, partial [Planctomycetia bacterium]